MPPSLCIGPVLALCSIESGSKSINDNTVGDIYRYLNEQAYLNLAEYELSRGNFQ